MMWRAVIWNAARFVRAAITLLGTGTGAIGRARACAAGRAFDGAGGAIGGAGGEG